MARQEKPIEYPKEHTCCHVLPDGRVQVQMTDLKTGRVETAVVNAGNPKLPEELREASSKAASAAVAREAEAVKPNEPVAE